jgi:hypothetical protein
MEEDRDRTEVREGTALTPAEASQLAAWRRLWEWLLAPPNPDTPEAEAPTLDPHGQPTPPSQQDR